jgi:hypothetical protein
MGLVVAKCSNLACAFIADTTGYLLLSVSSRICPQVTLAPKRRVALTTPKHKMILRPRDLHRVPLLLSLNGEDLTPHCLDMNFVEGMDYVVRLQTAI